MGDGGEGGDGGLRVPGVVVGGGVGGVVCMGIVGVGVYCHGGGWRCMGIVGVECGGWWGYTLFLCAIANGYKLSIANECSRLSLYIKY